MSLDRSHCQSSFEEARTTDTQAQDWSCSASVIRGGAWSCLFGQLPTSVLVEARTALVGEHHSPGGYMQGISHASQSTHAREEVCVPCHHEAARGWFQIMQERRCLWVPAGVLSAGM